MNRFKRKALRVVSVTLLIVIKNSYFVNCYFVIFFDVQVIADFFSNEELEDIKDTFKRIDTDDDGIITIEELKTGLQKLNTQLAESEVQLLIEAVSLTAY